MKIKLCEWPRVQEEQTRLLKGQSEDLRRSPPAIFDTNGCSEEVVKKNKVVAGKKLTRLSFEIFKIGPQEAEIRRDKGASTFCKY